MSPAPAPATLDRLRPGQSATIRRVAGSGAVAQRMLALGLMEGTEVRVVRLAPVGDPMEIELLGYALSLRKSEAGCVEVENVR